MERVASAYVGKAGQFFALSEFLIRGWNVAIPEVDIGDDLFVVRDTDGNFRRVQVKTSTATADGSRESGQFSVPKRQLGKTIEPELYYFFLLRNESGWGKFVIISRAELAAIQFRHEGDDSAGKDGYITFKIYFHADGTVLCRKENISNRLKDFSAFPDLTEPK